MDRNLEWVVASGERLRIGGANGMSLKTPPPLISSAGGGLPLRRGEGGFGIKYPVIPFAVHPVPMPVRITAPPQGLIPTTSC